MAAWRRRPAWQHGGSAVSLAAAARWEVRRQRGSGGQLGSAAAARCHQRQHHGGKRGGATRDPSVSAEGHVLMTPGGQGLRAGVGQGPHAPEVERPVPPIVSGPVEVGGETQ
jgi:hypothetical protein